MRILTLASVLALGLVACNQIAGIKKPEDKGGTSGGTGTGDDTTVGDDTTTTDDTGTGTTLDCTLTSGCDETTTCTSLDQNGNGTCFSVGPQTEGQSCSSAALCGHGLACLDAACFAYCTGACDDTNRQCVQLGNNWGACFSDCTSGDPCLTGYECRAVGTTGVSVCVPPTIVELMNSSSK